MLALAHQERARIERAVFENRSDTRRPPGVRTRHDLRYPRMRNLFWLLEIVSAVVSRCAGESDGLWGLMGRPVEWFDSVSVVRITQVLLVFGALLLGAGLVEATPDNSSFIDSVYADLLNRNPDQAGQTAWTSALGSGALGRGSVALSIMSSPEHDLDVVQGLYTRLLGRSMDQQGLGYVGALQQGVIRERVIGAILGSGEYFTNRGGGTDLGFLKALYQDVLHRDLDSVGRSQFGALLANGVSRADVAAMVLQSREARQMLVGNLYQELLRRSVEAEGRDAWVSLLEHGGTVEDIIAGLIGSDEYYYLDRSDRTGGGLPLDPVQVSGSGVVTSTSSDLWGALPSPPDSYTWSGASDPPGGQQGDVQQGDAPAPTAVPQPRPLVLMVSGLALLFALNARGRRGRPEPALSRPGTS